MSCEHGAGAGVSCEHGRGAGEGCHVKEGGHMPACACGVRYINTSLCCWPGDGPSFCVMGGQLSGWLRGFSGREGHLS